MQIPVKPFFGWPSTTAEVHYIAQSVVWQHKRIKEAQWKGWAVEPFASGLNIEVMPDHISKRDLGLVTIMEEPKCVSIQATGVIFVWMWVTGTMPLGLSRTCGELWTLSPIFSLFLHQRVHPVLDQWTIHLTWIDYQFSSLVFCRMINLTGYFLSAMHVGNKRKSWKLMATPASGGNNYELGT